MLAEGGLMSITGEENGPPVRVGVAIADIGAGMYATQAILSALLERELGDGRGQKIDVSLLDGQVAWMSYMASYYFATDEPPKRMGSKHPTIAPYQAFPTGDGHIVVAIPSENLWPKFCNALGRTDLVDHPRFAENADRVAHRDELDSLLTEELGKYSTEELLTLFDEHDVPCSDVKDLSQVFENPQVRERNMHQTVSHPTAGEIEMSGSPMHFSRSPTSIRQHPPLLGEHTTDILQELGYSTPEIAELRDDHII